MIDFLFFNWPVVVSGFVIFILLSNVFLPRRR